MTEAHIALYRKYRPKTFEEVRGQDSIVKVLEGAIAKKTIPHALLFTGSRGVGKTSIARIFASAIGTHPNDIYEIDAASNRGIDDIRELREAVHTLPYQSERKVYIIDEVHMLTKEAFNAFLKTLEEPPKHVVFILATTEADKLLDTIVSRCQVFTFKAPTRELLREAIMDAAKEEGFSIDTDAGDLIALAADGSYRDGYGILERVIMGAKGKKATADEVAEIIGAPKSQMLMDVVLSIHEKNVEKGLSALKSAATQNVDMKLFSRLVLERVRAVMLVRHSPSDAEVLLSQFRDEDSSALRVIAKDVKSPLNSQALVRLIEAADQTGRVSIDTLPLEIALVDLATKPV
jgi:DNA polymerase III subunit gamma/tau